VWASPGSLSSPPLRVNRHAVRHRPARAGVHRASLTSHGDDGIFTHQTRVVPARPRGAATSLEDPEVGVPQKKSAKKRLKQNATRNQRNRSVKSTMATAVRGARAASPEERDGALKRAVAAIARAEKAGVIKKQTANRKKSRLVRELSGTA
jgi:small subunit ribosomal protein S20